jgi:hypothetical protein
MNLKPASVDNGGTASDRDVPSIQADVSGRVRRGVDSARGRAERLTAGARRAGEGAANFARNERMRTLLIAFAVSVALSAVARLMGRSPDGNRAAR